MGRNTSISEIVILTLKDLFGNINIIKCREVGFSASNTILLKISFILDNPNQEMELFSLNLYHDNMQILSPLVSVKEKILASIIKKESSDIQIPVEPVKLLVENIMIKNNEIIRQVLETEDLENEIIIKQQERSEYMIFSLFSKKVSELEVFNISLKNPIRSLNQVKTGMWYSKDIEKIRGGVSVRSSKIYGTSIFN